MAMATAKNTVLNKQPATFFIARIARIITIPQNI